MGRPLRRAPGNPPGISRTMARAAAQQTLPVLLALLVSGAAALHLPTQRPAACDPATCAGCSPYQPPPPAARPVTDTPEPVCGADGAYFPVPVAYTCDGGDRIAMPRAWRCVACCEAGCAAPGGACSTRDYGAEEALGCQACPPGLALSFRKARGLEFAPSCTRQWASTAYGGERRRRWRVAAGPWLACGRALTGLRRGHGLPSWRGAPGRHAALSPRAGRAAV